MFTILNFRTKSVHFKAYGHTNMSFQQFIESSFTFLKKAFFFFFIFQILIRKI